MTQITNFTPEPTFYRFSGTSNSNNTYANERTGTLRKRLCLRVPIIVNEVDYFLYTVACAFHALCV